MVTLSNARQMDTTEDVLLARQAELIERIEKMEKKVWACETLVESLKKQITRTTVLLNTFLEESDRESYLRGDD